jgi:hypothetical protein
VWETIGFVPYAANVLSVMIASPGDCVHERAKLREAILELSVTQSAHTGIVFMPRLWEHDAIPDARTLPQSSIDEQIAARADVLVALFRHTVGRSRVNGVPATIHEIELCRQRDIPVHIYFYSGPADPTVDAKQWANVQQYQEDLGGQSLYGEFAEDQVLVKQVVRALEDDARRLAGAGNLPKTLTEEEVRQIASSEAMVWSVVFGS